MRFEHLRDVWATTMLGPEVLPSFSPFWLASVWQHSLAAQTYLYCLCYRRDCVWTMACESHSSHSFLLWSMQRWRCMASRGYPAEAFCPYCRMSKPNWNERKSGSIGFVCGLVLWRWLAVTHLLFDGKRLSVVWARSDIGVLGVVAVAVRTREPDGVWPFTLRALFCCSRILRSSSHWRSMTLMIGSPLIKNSRPLFSTRYSSTIAVISASIFGKFEFNLFRSFSSRNSWPPRLLYRFGSVFFASSASHLSNQALRSANFSKIALQRQRREETVTDW